MGQEKDNRAIGGTAARKSRAGRGKGNVRQWRKRGKNNGKQILGDGGKGGK